jgi:hypothetical protein
MLAKPAAVLLMLCALTAPARADIYPVSGQWGQSSSRAPGAIDCAGKRVIGFSGNQRTDSHGGVPAYRNYSVTAAGPSQYRVIDRFSNAQTSSGSTSYTLRKIDDDHIELKMQGGSTLKLQRCK